MPDDQLTLPILSSARLGLASANGMIAGLIAKAELHRVPVTIAFVVPVVIGIALGIISKPVYVAQARLLVLYADDYVFHPGDHGTGNDITLDRNQVMQAELQILQSQALANQTLSVVGPKVFYPKLESAAMNEASEQFGRDLTVSAIPQSNIIELDLRSNSRDLAIGTLQTLIDKYLPYRASIFDKTPAQQVVGDREMFATRLREAESKLASFSLEHGISNLPEQTSLAIQQLGQNTNDQASVTQQEAESEGKLAAVRNLLSREPRLVQVYADSTRSQQISGLTDSLVKLTGKRQELQEQYNPNAPMVQDLESQIAAVRSQIAATNPREGTATRVGRNPVYDELKNQEANLDIQVQGLKARQSSLASQAQVLKARHDELVSLSQQYHDLQRNRDVLDQSYREISRSNESSQLATAFQRAAGTNLRVIQPPDAPVHGKSVRMLMVAGGFLVGLLSAAVTLTLMILFNPEPVIRRA